MKAEREPHGGCLLRLSQEEMEGIGPDQDTPESRYQEMMIFFNIKENVQRVRKLSPVHPYANDAKFVYELFLHYWNPDRKDAVLSQLEKWLAEQDICIDKNDRGDSIVKLLKTNGQTPFVVFILRNMKGQTFKEVYQRRAFTNLMNKLTAVLWYKGHMVTENSMSNTLSRAVKRVACEKV